jgi:hypothetical protein
MRSPKQLCRKRPKCVDCQTGVMLAVCLCLRCCVLRDDQVLIKLGHDLSQRHAGDNLRPEVRLRQTPQLSASTNRDGISR